MRLVFAGTPEPAVVALEKLLASSHEVVAVMTRPDARRGRGRTLHPSPVSALAQEHGVEVLTPTTLKAGTDDGESIRQRLQELAPDAVPVVAYGHLLPKDVIDIPEHGFINLHFSLLPAWRGAAPTQAALLNGDEVTGVTTFQIDEGMDTGDILGMREEKIRLTDTADDLLTRLAYLGADLLVETMDALAAGTAEPTPQSGEASYAAKISSADARVDWEEEAVVIDRRVRAYTPAPGAWTMLAGERFKIGPLSVTDADELDPGQIKVSKDSVRVGTGTADVELGGLQPPGKKMMVAADWARGLHNTEGLVFE